MVAEITVNGMGLREEDLWPDNEIWQVLRSFIIKRKQLQGYEDIKFVILIMGGGGRAIAGVAQCAALLNNDLSGELVDAVFGNSAGIATGLYYLAGKSSFKRGKELFIKEVPRNIRPWKPWRPFDTSSIVSMIEKGEYAVDWGEVLRSNSQLYAGVANPLDEFRFVDIKTMGLSYIEPAMTMTTPLSRLVGFHGMEIDGEVLRDGAMVQPMPLRTVIEMTGATDVLVIPNVTRTKCPKTSFSQISRAINEVLGGKKTSDATRKEIEENSKINGFGTAKRKFPGTRIGIWWPPDFLKIKLFNRKSGSLDSAYVVTLHDADLMIKAAMGQLYLELYEARR